MPDTVPGETFEDETRGSQTGELQDVLPDGGMDMGGIADTSGAARYPGEGPALAKKIPRRRQN